MNTVQKFSLTVADQLEVEMPLGAQLLHVALVKARPCLWALVDESRPRVRRRFRLTATSEPIRTTCPTGSSWAASSWAQTIVICGSGRALRQRLSPPDSQDAKTAMRSANRRRARVSVV
jgi:hypothetical protein